MTHAERLFWRILTGGPIFVLYAIGTIILLPFTVIGRIMEAWEKQP